MSKVVVNLKLKLILLLIGLCLFPILVISYINYKHIKDELIYSTKMHIEAIADLKADEIERFFERKINDINTITTSPYVENLIKLSNNKHSLEYIKSKNILDEQILKFIHKRDIDEVYIVNIDGALITSVSNGAKGLQYYKEAFENGKNKLYFSNVYKGHNNSILFTISAPILNKDNQTIGVAIVEVIFDTFFKQIQDYRGLGATGETLLGKRVDDRVIFINPLKYDKNAPMNKSVIIDSNAGIPIQRAANGQNGSGIATDYRGQEVVAAWRSLEIPHWGLVAKIDTVEVYKISDSAKTSIIISSILLIIFLFAIAILIGQNLFKPIDGMEKDAFTDPLTKLPNRRLLENILNLKLEKSQLKNSMLAVLFLDLDGFKAVNDTYGHEIGDKLLQGVADRLVNMVRQSDTVARLGGDEFVVVLIGVNHIKNVERISNDIILALNEPFIFDDIEASVGVSIGISLYPDNATNKNSLMQQADEAMYLAKKSGKNHFRFYPN